MEPLFLSLLFLPFACLLCLRSAPGINLIFPKGNGCVCSGWAARDGWLGAASWVCILGAILTRGAISL